MLPRKVLSYVTGPQACLYSTLLLLTLKLDYFEGIRRITKLLREVEARDENFSTFYSNWINDLDEMGSVYNT